VCKHCNIIYTGADSESFINISDVRQCKVAKIDWTGRVVYIGLDLSQTDDNTSVSMLAIDDDNNILAESFAFIPEGRIEEKTVSEKVNYRELLKSGKVIACGDMVIDYSVVEAFILGIEERFGVQIQAIGYDRWNALSTAQKLENAGYNMVEVKQHSSVLHPATKLLKESILERKFQYTKNPLYEINFQNARCQYDTNKNLYITKKRSKGKVDMCVSTLNALCLLQQDALLGMGDGWTVQTF
jgi:phage terminase large subunit-like protein